MLESIQPDPNNLDLAQKNPDILQETEAVLEASRTFSHELVELYPQTNEDGSLRYIIVGSLATNLLVQSEVIEQIDGQELTGFAVLEGENTVPFTPEEQALSARKIGDLDIVFLPEARETTEGTTRLNAMKGGDQLAVSKFSSSALELFKTPDQLQAIFLDPLYSADPQVVRVKVDGQEYYIASPVSILANKANHLCLTYVTSSDEKRQQLNQDLRNAFAIASKFTDRQTVIAEIHDIIMKYAYEEANATVLPTAEHDLAEDNISLLQEVIATDEDYTYFEKTGISIERAVGVLRVLHRFSNPVSKERVAEYIAAHKDIIDTTSVSAQTRNINILVHLLLTEENAGDIRDKFAFSTQGTQDINEENLAAYLRTHPHLISDLAERYPNEQYERVPERSTLLQMLMYVDEVHVDQELQQIDTLLASGVRITVLNSLFRDCSSKVESSDLRQEIIHNIVAATSQLDTDKLNRFMLAVMNIVGSFTLQTDKEKEAAIQASCEEFGVSVTQ